MYVYNELCAIGREHSIKNKTDKMKIAIIGGGGVGGYFGAKLAKAGFDVSLLVRGKHLTEIIQNGLTIKSIQKDFQIDKIFATDKIKEIGQSDLIILGVKAWQFKEIASDLKLIVHNDTLILPLQNGISIVDEIKEHINASNILGGLCRIISKVESPGVINHFGLTPTIVFGEIDKSKSLRIHKLKEIFDKSGINTQISFDIYSDLWKKFIEICVGGLLAITKITYGELRELKETRQMMVELLNEVYLLSQRVGIDIEQDFIEKTLSFVDSFPYNTTFSLTRDVWEGKPSEIEYQNGTVVRLGQQYGIDTPVNRFVYNCILPMEIKARTFKT